MFDSLDFLYTPAPDIHKSVNYYVETLGCELMWKIHAYGVWVACLKASVDPPYILLADHVQKKDGIITIYRVGNLDRSARELRSRGWRDDRSLEIPPGPCSVFYDPAGNTLAIYENARPGVMREFQGRIDKE